MRSAWALLVALTLALSAAVYARQSGRLTQDFAAGINLVQVEVSVLDRNRRPVRGLQATDFTLLEDGRPRPIAAFAVVDLPRRANTARAAWMRDVRSDVATNSAPDQGRLVVILMDRTIPFGAPAVMARDVAGAAIEALAPGDLAAVVYTGSGVPQGFTSDRARLLAAVGANPSAELSADTVERWENLKDWQERGLWPRDSNAPPPPGLEDGQASPWDRDIDSTGPSRILRTDESGECPCGVCVLDTIRTIADAVQDVQGRRKLLLFIGADIITDSKTPQCQGVVMDARQAMLRSIYRANLTVHAFDANGLESNVIPSSSQGRGLTTPISPREGVTTLTMARSQQLLTRQGHLAVLPDHTGGRTVLNTNNPAGRVPEVFRESESYYLLGFEPATIDGREHTIGVRVNRPGVNVRSRSAYVSNPPAPVALAAPADQARGAIESVIAERDGVALTANVLAVAAPGTHDPVLVVALHAQHDASRELPVSGSEMVDIVTAVFTREGRPVGTLNQTVAVAPRTEIGGVGLAYDVLQRIPAKPGRYELRIGVYNAARRQRGSVHAFVDIPAIGKVPFAWSDIGIADPAFTPVTNDGFVDVVPALPVARRDFGRQERMTAFISGYHVSGPLPAPLDIVTHVTDDRNRRHLERRVALTPADFAPSRAATYTIDLPLASLEPGSYLLTMEARAAGARTTRHVRFTVR